MHNVQVHDAGSRAPLGAPHDERTILTWTWRAFWNVRQQLPAWRNSSELLQFSICIEQSQIFSWSPSPLAPRATAWNDGRPLAYMDGVRELMTVVKNRLQADPTLTTALSGAASPAFGGAYGTW